MPNSGIKITDDAKNAFGRVFKRNDSLRYAVFMFSDDLKEVVVDYDDKFYEKHLHYNDLLDKLPSDTPRFVAYDLPHMNKDGTKTSTVILVSWCPKDCKTKHKFVTGTTFQSLRQALGDPKYLEGDDTSDLNETEVCKKKDWIKIDEESRDPLPQETVQIRQ